MSRGPAAVALVLCLATGAHSAAPRAGFLAQLRRDLGDARVVAPMLSVSAAHVPCAASAALPGSVPRTVCPRHTLSPASRRRVARLSARATAAVHSSVDPQALHASALIDLIWSEGAGTSLDRSISSLRQAARLTDRPAAVLADLAGGLLVRAEATQNPRDLLEAVEVADSALGLEPANAAARFNLALALERAQLVEQAARAWDGYLALDAASGWAHEARARSAAARTRAETAPAGAQASPPRLRAYAQHSAQEARLLAMDVLLADWGEAVLAGDSARARARLAGAAAVGDALEGSGGDRSVADAVRAIRAIQASPAYHRALAAAHEAYGAGQRAHQLGSYRRAREHFVRAGAGAGHSPVLRQWARYAFGVADYYSGGSEAAAGFFGRLAEEADTLRHPALAARARWSRGLLTVRTAGYMQGIADYEAAARLFGRIGERENLGAMHALLADAYFALGDQASGYRRLYQGLEALRPYRGSVRLHNVLYELGKVLAAERLPRVAMRVHEEGVAVARRQHPGLHAEALLARARARTLAGNLAGAASDVRSGERLADSLPDAFQRAWIQQDARLARAALSLRRGTGSAAAALDSVVAFYARKALPDREMAALLTRAEARMALADVPGAMADLERATAMLDRVSQGIESAALRASLLETARSSFDALVMLHLRAGRPEEALRALERGRASFGAELHAGAGEPQALSPRGGGTALDYALIGDTLLVWLVRGHDVQMRRAQVDRRALLQATERVRLSLEVGAPQAVFRGDLAMLYERLVGPVEERLPRDGGLWVVADGELADVPFAALWNAGRGRYLVEDYTLRFAAALRETRAPSRQGPPGRHSAVLVADPAFDPRTYPALPRLAGAREEVRTIERGYPGAAVLTGATASRDAVQSALAGTGVLHFAGHAVFDDERPDHSYLVLADIPGKPGTGRLAALDLRRMDLRNLRLVVLSACQTQRGRGGRSAGFAGLSGALLSAGAGGVVGSLWRVGDDPTRLLMAEFHRGYRASGDPAQALRSAQVGMLRSSDPALRSPSAWAAFRYTGG